MNTQTILVDLRNNGVPAAVATLLGAYIGRSWGIAHWGRLYYGMEERAEGEFRATLTGALCFATIWIAVKYAVKWLRRKRDGKAETKDGRMVPPTI